MREIAISQLYEYVYLRYIGNMTSLNTLPICFVTIYEMKDMNDTMLVFEFGAMIRIKKDVGANPKFEGKVGSAVSCTPTHYQIVFTDNTIAKFDDTQIEPLCVKCNHFDQAFVKSWGVNESRRNSCTIDGCRFNSMLPMLFDEMKEI